MWMARSRHWPMAKVGEGELEVVGAEDVVGGVVDSTTQELPIPHQHALKGLKARPAQMT